MSADEQSGSDRESPVEEIKVTRNKLRSTIKSLGTTVRALSDHPDFIGTQADGDVADRGEMQANIMLTYRHLEDARMRLGKVIQAQEGGVSIFDK